VRGAERMEREGKVGRGKAEEGIERAL